MDLTDQCLKSTVKRKASKTLVVEINLGFVLHLNHKSRNSRILELTKKLVYLEEQKGNASYLAMQRNFWQNFTATKNHPWKDYGFITTWSTSQGRLYTYYLPRRKFLRMDILKSRRICWKSILMISMYSKILYFIYMLIQTHNHKRILECVSEGRAKSIEEHMSNLYMSVNGPRRVCWARTGTQE